MTKFSKLYKKFNTLPVSKKEAFLKTLYKLSPENETLFELWVQNDPQTALNNFITQIEKETTRRIGRYRKIRLSKINETLRAAKKCALPTFETLQLQNTTWQSILENLLSRTWWPDRYEKACARHLEKYIEMVRLHIVDKSARDELLQATEETLSTILDQGTYLPNIENVYHSNFN